MPFLVEGEPERGMASLVSPGVRRLVARNPSPMTYFGTNTYLIEHGAEYIVLDPGPPTDPRNVEDIIRHTDGRVSAIVLSHGHIDHAGAVAVLKEVCKAPVYAFQPSIFPGLIPDVPLRDGDVVGPLRAIHTPGHAADHLCFARDDGVLFTADHVMGWSSTVVSPPGGSMDDYLAGLRRLLNRDDAIYLPGHGPAIVEPRAHVQDLLNRRLWREKQILRAVQTEPRTTNGLSRDLYRTGNPTLHGAAERNVLAHLLKLQQQGRVVLRDNLWSASA